MQKNPEPSPLFIKLGLTVQESQVICLLLRSFPYPVSNDRLNMLFSISKNRTILRRSVIAHIRQKLQLKIKAHWGFGYSLTEEDKMKLDEKIEQTSKGLKNVEN